MIIATAGHIDHGKSSLVKAITGVDTDRLPEEKKRGMSIDLGFAYQRLSDNRTLGFVDVPGHEKFIKNMLAGVTGVDYAILIVAADDGPMPQTIEHLAILDLLGVTEGIIALTKIDRVNEDRFYEVHDEIRRMVEGTCLERSDVFPVSAIKGEGVAEVLDHLEMMSELLADKKVEGNFRLAIDRCFTVPGTGQVVTGAVFSGEVSVGDNLILSPQGTNVRVRGIHAQNKETKIAVSGERCAVNITSGDLNKTNIYRGGWLLANELNDPVPRFDARIRVLQSEVRALSHWTPVHVHLGSAEFPGRVAVLQDKSIAPGENGLVQIVLDRRTSALRGDGFIIRDQSAQRTIGGGRILDPYSPARGRAKPERIEFLAAMELNPAEVALQKLLEQSPLGVNFSEFIKAWNLTSKMQLELLEKIEQIKLDDGEKEITLSPVNFEKIRNIALNGLKDWHHSNQDKPGPGMEALRISLPMRIPQKLFEVVLQVLVSEKRIIYTGGHYYLPGFETKLSKKDDELWTRVRPILESGFMQPPVVHALANELSLDPRRLEKFLISSAKLGLVCQVAKNRFLLPKAIAELANIVVELGENEKTFSVKEFRDRSGIGRNLAIEILEFFDKSGFTWRGGDTRKVLKSVFEVFGELERN